LRNGGSGRRDGRGRRRALIPKSTRKVKLALQLTNLLTPCSEADLDRTKIEYPRSSFSPLGRWGVLSTCGGGIVRAARWQWWLLTLRLRAAAKLDSKAGGTVLRATGTLFGDGGTASWTNLLTFQPALEAAEVQNMTTRQLFGPHPVDSARVVGRIPGVHLFSADDACVLP
jgi:hypothetical protein